MWAPGSSHTRTLVDRTAAALLQVRAACGDGGCLSRNAFYRRLQGPRLLSGRCRPLQQPRGVPVCPRRLRSPSAALRRRHPGGHRVGSDGRRSVRSAARGGGPPHRGCDPLVSGLAGAVSASREWRLILQSTLAAAEAAARARREELLRRFDSPGDAAALAESLTGEQPQPQQQQQASVATLSRAAAIDDDGDELGGGGIALTELSLRGFHHAPGQVREEAPSSCSLPRTPASAFPSRRPLTRCRQRRPRPCLNRLDSIALRTTRRSSWSRRPPGRATQWWLPRRSPLLCSQFVVC